MDGLFNAAKDFLGGGTARPAPNAATGGDDFADFAGAPDPTPASIVADSASSAFAQAASPTPGSIVPLHLRPYTAWYRVWERVEPRDFQSELFIIPFIIIILAVHVWGTRKNRSKARAWAKQHIPLLEAEFSMVGFDRAKPSGYADKPEEALKKLAEHDYLGYASGRLNTAMLDVKLNFDKRYNPMGRIGEEAIGYFVDSMPAPRETMTATAFCFDGAETVLLSKEAAKAEKFKSTFDGFVFAVVHKDSMKYLRESRYDLSLTTTKDNQKLPVWATIMSESAEISDALLTPELIDAVKQAGDQFDALIVSDSPIERPRSLNELAAKKRVQLSLHIPSSDDYANSIPLFKYFLRLPDVLASGAHFRPEALRRVRQTREEEIKRIKKGSEEEKNEERRLKLEKDKKEERDRKLKSMSADEQRKYLERERALDMRRGQKKKAVKG